MDPHQRSATIEVIDGREKVLAQGRYGTDSDGYRAMLAAGRRYPRRIWAVEGCNGIGRHVAQRLVADGESVVDVPAKLSARARVFGTGQGRKADPVEAHSVAVVALRTSGLRQLAADLVTELAVIDKKIKLADKALNELIAATGSRLQQLHGIGPSNAARLLGDIGDITRFASRNHFASWNGTAPLDASSGDQQRHRLSRAGNRRINRALHIMAVVQLRHDTEGRRYFRRKLAAGKTAMEAMRCLKRRLSDVVYRQMLTDAKKASPGGQSGASVTSSAADPTPTVDSSDKPLPGLNREPTPPTTPADVDQAPCSRELPGSRRTRTATLARPTAVTSTSGTTTARPRKRSSSRG